MIHPACVHEDDPAAVEEILAREAHSAHHSEPSTPLAINPRILRRFPPIEGPFEPAKRERTEAEIDLGRMLFMDKRLSKAKDIACSTCHPLEQYGVDNRARGQGHEGALTARNVPTVYNAAGALMLGWDGAARNVEEQVWKPMTADNEMAMPENEGAQPLASDPRLPRGVRGGVSRRIRPDKPRQRRARDRAFERGLVTPGRWDDFLLGATEALTPLEKKGLRTFINVGCITCHTGALLGGSMMTKLGLKNPWPTTTDEGRKAVTGQPTDAMKFRVPTLRNVAQTQPYFHDGSESELDGAIRKMAHHQLGAELEEDDIAAIAAWLRALTGDLLDRLRERSHAPGRSQAATGRHRRDPPPESGTSQQTRQGAYAGVSFTAGQSRRALELG